jgi:hypothetical protein
VLSEAAYRRRPELLEGGLDAAWVPRPLRRPRYKACSRRFRVRVSPHVAEHVESFDGTPLSEYFHELLGLPEGAEVEAEVHLYEALPGTSAAEIARGESDATGLGAADEASLAQLHPLTHEAASLLLGRPDLGRPLPPRSSRRYLFGGQRLYHLAIPGKRPLLWGAAPGHSRVRRLGRVRVTLDVVRDEVRVSVFFSEARAQRLAVRLRESGHPGSLGVSFQKRVAPALGAVLDGRHPRRLRLVHPGVPPTASPAALLERLPPALRQAFMGKLLEALLRAFKTFVRTRGAEFATAASAPADGVTLRFIVQQMPGFKELGQLLVDRGPRSAAVLDAISGASLPQVRVEVFPGRTHG